MLLVQCSMVDIKKGFVAGAASGRNSSVKEKNKQRQSKTATKAKATKSKSEKHKKKTNNNERNSLKECPSKNNCSLDVSNSSKCIEILFSSHHDIIRYFAVHAASTKTMSSNQSAWAKTHQQFGVPYHCSFTLRDLHRKTPPPDYRNQTMLLRQTKVRTQHTPITCTPRQL